MKLYLSISILFLSFGFLALGQGLEFGASFYQRDNSRNTLKGRGAAWVRMAGKEISADELEVDLTLNRVFATGNVHIKDKDLDIFCESGTYALEGGDASLEKATLIFGQTVISGSAINQLSKEDFEVQDGVYTNCNTVPFVDRDVAKCPFDVKIYARKFFLTLESYVHIYDAILYTKELPVFYTPYFVAPAKTKRQTGVLVPSLTFRERLGTGFSLPLFIALGSWHDLTLTPTWWTNIGYHLGIDYRYIYSSTKKGQARIFLLERPFNPNESIAWVRPSEHRYAGLFSEAALDIHNQLSLFGRTQSRQDINLVTNNFWTQDFPNDLGGLGDFQYLRNQISFSAPGNSTLTTATVKLNQSIVNTIDHGADKGSVGSAPEIRFYQKTSPLFWDHFYFEVGSRFTNYIRPNSAWDNIPSSRITTNADLANNNPLFDLSNPIISDSNTDFDSNDFLRVGRRLHLEPRLVANAPLAPGFQFQPVLKAGLLAYQFDLPQPSIEKQSYIETEIPFALYLSRTYGSAENPEEKIRHIVQPRVLFSASLYKSATPQHVFFAKSDYPGFTSPRFDILDDNQEFGFFRFEFNNRLLKKVSNEAQRFMLAQLSSNYFVKPSPLNN
ncbi:MAG: LPS-assembly protein LptD, partial [Proteobacteria bacterium]|nr:LPS-assembly protein LptD [Pseudomonadota bacterium]